jgi:hypothetical protein
MNPSLPPIHIMPMQFSQLAAGMSARGFAQDAADTSSAGGCRQIGPVRFLSASAGAIPQCFKKRLECGCKTLVPDDKPTTRIASWPKLPN